MEKDDFESGYVIISEGKFIEVGNMKDLKRDESKFSFVFDAKGDMLLPGFVDAHCHIGLFEEGVGDIGMDGNEDTSPITPQLRAIDAINPFDSAFSDARSGGVTTVVTGPGSANVIGGQFAAIKTYGRCIDDMIIKEPVAMKAALGENPTSVYSARKEAPVTRMATAAILREALFTASEYNEKVKAYKKNPDENEKPEFDFKAESLLPVLNGEIPMKVHAHRADDICTAIRIADEFNIRITLEHCTEGHFICDIIKRKDIPVMLGPTLSSKSKLELKNLSFDIYKCFEKEGIDFAIITDHPEITIDNLYLCASLAVRNGLSKETAMRAITINAARATDISERVGSVKEGKDADFVIISGELFSLDSKIKKVFIEGKEI
ncbi:MAG: amidohydrolase [Ruminococcaceae bacterium]|nr:amidohydrolase [Oscillospiraceae bacterium]